MSNIKITFHFHDVRAWPLNGGRAPSKLFNDHHTSLQSLLHSKTLVHSQNFRPQQSVSLYGTHTNNSPCRFIVQWSVDVCGVHQSNKTFSGGKCCVHYHTNSFVDTGCPQDPDSVVTHFQQPSNQQQSHSKTTRYPQQFNTVLNNPTQ